MWLDFKINWLVLPNVGSNIKINKTAQTISVPGYDVRKNNFIENYITMDWKNKLYIYKNQDGKDIVFDGK